MKDNILNFLADNYLIFMIVAVILLFALIGFIVDGKKKKQKGGEVVPGASVPPQPAPAMVNSGMAPQADTVTPAPAVAPAPVEPSLSGLEATANDVTLNTSTPVTPQVAPATEAPVESIFNTPAVESPVSATTEKPTLVIEEPAPMVQPEASVQSPEVMAPPIGETPSIGEIPSIGETPSIGTTPVAPQVETSTVTSEVAPVAPSVPETPVTPSIGETPSIPAAPVSEAPTTPGTPLQ